MPARNLQFIALIFSALFLSTSCVQATFSIVAIDTVTNEIGVAAASCVPGGIISDICHVEPNTGGIIAQAYFIPENLTKGVELMRQNLSALDIITELVTSDEEAYDRQYGVVTLQGGIGCFFGTELPAYGTFKNSTLQPGVQCTAFSGNNLPNWEGQIVGHNYSIQGNTLSGAKIVLDMEAAFLETEGALPIKLMAALQAAKQIGADSRCDTTSSLCACIKVGLPTDTVDNLLLNINVTNVEGDPIDSLQAEFDRVYPPPPGKSLHKGASEECALLRNYPNPFNPQTTIRYDLPKSCQPSLKIFNMRGQLIRTLIGNEQVAGMHSVVWDGRDQNGNIVSSGVYLCRLVVEDEFIETKKIILQQ